ncbi:NAD kinase [bacterium HR26]|nr:NAD kinase [bacterium HR26]
MTIGIIAAHGKPEAAELAERIAGWLSERGSVALDESALQRDASAASVLVTIGGDGLIMRMAHVYPDVPILGINVGRVGFLAMIEREEWQPALQRLVEGDYWVQESPTLAASVWRGDQLVAEGWAINDVVIRSGFQMIEVELYIDGQFVNTYPGDGMIVATPQGSTAYCMAAGGPVLSAGVRGFAVTPICPHSPIRTTLVVPEEALIEQVVASEREASLILDGAPHLELRAGDLVQVRRGSHRFRLVLLPEMNFYEAFRSKFNFQIRPDARPTRPVRRPPARRASRS